MVPNDNRLWNNILLRIHGTFPNAFIGGGAIRDNYLGLTPKDIDVFVPVSSQEEFEEAIKRFDAKLHPIHICSANIEEYDEWEKGRLLGVATVRWFGVDVQFIARAGHVPGKETEMVSKFDGGCNQAFYLLGQPIWTSGACRKDWAEHTYTDVLGQNWSTQRRFDRFNERNPGKLRFVSHHEYLTNIGALKSCFCGEPFCSSCL